MGKLRRLKNQIKLDPSEDTLSLEDPRGLSEINEDSDTEIVREDIDIDGLDQLVARVIDDNERYSTSADSDMIVELHRLLPLTRREASDRYLWAWLGWIRYPHLVAHRWKPGGDGSRASNRFVGDRVRQTFARLWWAAELTVSDDGNYDLTEQLIGLRGFQDVYEAIFGRAFCQHPPAIRAFIRIVGNQPEQLVRETAKEFGYLLTTLVLETLSEGDLQETLEELVSSVRARY